MNAEELQGQLRPDHQPALLHVLREEVFAAAPLVAYGAGEGSLDAVTAAEKLRSAGFTQVQTFGGGLEEWQSAALPSKAPARFRNQPFPTAPCASPPVKSACIKANSRAPASPST